MSERSNFPTDLYIAESLCKQFGWTLSLVDATELQDALTPQVGVLLLTHVNYRTGAMHDMPAINQAAHDVGALVVWDLAHSAGAVPVALHAQGATADATNAAADADFAVGCGYKYLNGGPGAPAFVWVHPRHANEFAQPLAGWWGHSAPFAFTPGYTPATGTQRYLCGTQPVVSLALLECGLDTVLAAGPLGGMAALRAKSLALTDLFIALVEARCAGFGLGLVTPRVHGLRGSQVSFSHPAAYPMMQALIARGVIGDFRAGDAANGHAATHGHTPQPDLLRFGFTPLYIGFEDVWLAVEHVRQVLASGEWQQPQFNQRHSVT